MKPESYPRARMGTLLARNWKSVALRGAIAILFGMAIVVLPGVTVAVLNTLFGFFVLIGGFLFLVAAVRQRHTDEPWWLLLLEGILGIIVGIFIISSPGITALFFIYLIAAWAIVSGIFQIVAAIQLRRQIEGEWLLIVSGIISLIFGLLLAILPGIGALTILWIIGAYTVAFGVMQLILAWRLRNWRREEPPTVI